MPAIHSRTCGILYHWYSSMILIEALVKRFLDSYNFKTCLLDQKMDGPTDRPSSDGRTVEMRDHILEASLERIAVAA